MVYCLYHIIFTECYIMYFLFISYYMYRMLYFLFKLIIYVKKFSFVQIGYIFYFFKNCNQFVNIDFFTCENIFKVKIFFYFFICEIYTKLNNIIFLVFIHFFITYLIILSIFNFSHMKISLKLFFLFFLFFIFSHMKIYTNL